MNNATMPTRKSTTQWSDGQKLFQLWLALPEDEREQKRQEDVATLLGVSRQTLSEWKRLPGFMDAVHRQAYDLLKEALPKAFQTIARRALESERIEWMNLYLSLMGGQNVVAGANSSMQINQMTEDEATTLLERSLGLQLTARVTSDDKP